MRTLARSLGLVPLSTTSADRKTFILNVLLVAVMALIAVGLVIHVSVMAVQPLDETTYAQNSLPALSLLILLGFFTGLHQLSLRGYGQFSASVLVAVIFLLALYMQTRWGVDVTAAMLFYILAIVMAGILIRTNVALGILIVTAIAFFTVDTLQNTGTLIIDQYWRTQPWTNSDTIMTIVILGIIAVVSALSSWQSEYALKRALASEEALTHQRDRLEEIVEERTKELRIEQMERLANVYRFAEFGRLSSGLFHNLSNLLTALTLNIEHLSENMNQLETQSTAEVQAAKTRLEQAIQVNEKMRQFLESVRRQFSGQRRQVSFSAVAEARAAAEIVSHRAGELGIEIKLELSDQATLFGDPIIFHQIVTNLLSNAIDATQVGNTGPDKKQVLLRIEPFLDEVVLTVKDWGHGISSDIQEKIFEPFFTTKSDGQSSGLGLSLVKRMVENDFHGTLACASREGQYTEFVAHFPTKLTLDTGSHPQIPAGGSDVAPARTTER